MKLMGLTLIVGAIVFLFIASIPQEDEKLHIDEQQRQHMMEMMKDPGMAEMIMEHIASDTDLRMMMMQQMHTTMHGDGESMMEMCKKMMGDDHRRGAMMHEDKMSCCAEKSEKENGSDENHH